MVVLLVVVALDVAMLDVVALDVVDVVPTVDPVVLLDIKEVPQVNVSIPMVMAMADVDILLLHMAVDMAIAGMVTMATDMDIILEVAPMVPTLAVDTVLSLVDVVLLDVDVVLLDVDEDLVRSLHYAMMA